MSDDPQSRASAPEATSEPAPESGPSLSERAVSGGVFTVLRFGAENVLRMGSNLILTRILVPEDFGLMLLISVLMTGLAMFSDVGIASIVVQNRRGDDPAFLDTVWTVQVLRGALLTLIAMALAVPMAAFYEDARLRDLILVASLPVFIAGFNSIALFKLQRHLRIKKLAAIELSGELFRILVTIAWAVASPSVWALVYGGLVGSLGKLALSHLVAREHRCRFRWDSESIDELIDFGKWIFLSTILFFLAGQSDRLIFGRLISIQELGVFSIALIFATIPTQVIWKIGNAVVFPALSRRLESEGSHTSVYDRAQTPMLVLGVLPVSALLACGPELIEILYDPRYIGAGWMLQLLAIATWIQIPQASSGSLMLALGLPRWIAIANGIKFIGFVICLPAGWFLYGTPGAIAGLAGAELFRYLTLAVAVRRQKYPLFRADMTSTLFVACLSGLGLAIMQWLGDAGFGPWSRLGLGVLVLASLWAAVAGLLLREEIPRLRQGLADRRARRQPAGEVNA